MDLIVRQRSTIVYVTKQICSIPITGTEVCSTTPTKAMCLNDNNRMNNRYASATLQVWWMCSVILHGYYREESLYACGIVQPPKSASMAGQLAHMCKCMLSECLRLERCVKSMCHEWTILLSGNAIRRTGMRGISIANFMLG